MAKALFLFGLGAAALGAAVLIGKKPGDLVMGKSGKAWRVVLLGQVGGVKSYELIAPEASFGPHAEMSVLRYTQSGSDTASRKITGVGAGAPASVVQTAASDFGLPFDPALMPAT